MNFDKKQNRWSETDEESESESPRSRLNTEYTENENRSTAASSHEIPNEEEEKEKETDWQSDMYMKQFESVIYEFERKMDEELDEEGFKEVKRASLLKWHPDKCHYSNPKKRKTHEEITKRINEICEWESKKFTDIRDYPQMHFRSPRHLLLRYIIEHTGGFFKKFGREVQKFRNQRIEGVDDVHATTFHSNDLHISFKRNGDVVARYFVIPEHGWEKRFADDRETRFIHSMISKARDFHTSWKDHLGKAYFDNVDNLYNALEWLQAFQDLTDHHDMVLKNTSDAFEREDVPKEDNPKSEAKLFSLKN